MKRLRVLLLLLATGAGEAAAAVPPPELALTPADPVVTESWTARIVLYLPPLEGRYAEMCPLKAPGASPFGSLFDSARTSLSLRGFPVPDVRFREETARETRDGTDYWRVTLTSDPIPAERPGRQTVGPVIVEAALFDGRFQRGFFGVEPHIVRRSFRTGACTLTVHEPPATGRPAAYSGAIARALTAEAHLDAHRCTVGDPLVLTLEIKGLADPAHMRAPSLAAHIAHADAFRLDEASVKSRVAGDTRLFTWRVRARKAGTVEFPALPVAYFDAAARVYRTVYTSSIPVQVKPGAQVALGLSDDSEDAVSFPMPDGLDLDFPSGGPGDFTFRRAVTLACRAQTPADFAAAAAVYADYLMQLSPDPLAVGTPWRLAAAPAQARLYARHCANLGALRLCGGDARGAWQAYVRAGAYGGEDASVRRGLQAAQARRLNDPRADLPWPRMLFGAWYRWPVGGRVLLTAALVAILGLVWYLAGRLGRGGTALVLAGFLLLPHAASAQFGHLSFGGGAPARNVRAEVALVPADLPVGVPGALVFSFEVERGVEVEEVRFSGLPEPEEAHLVYGAPERMSDGATAVKDRTVRRIRVPVRFLAPYNATCAPRVEGMLVTRRGAGTSFSFSSSVNFAVACAPVTLAVAPLPEEGRPADFAGAAGRRFVWRVRLAPSRVHPGDLVTADYRLTFEGYFPTNLLPRLEGLDAFRAYPPEEVARTGSSVAWRQMLVPNSVAATNRVAVAVDYYDLDKKRYQTATAAAPPLVFVSATAASTSNTAVLVDAPAVPEGAVAPGATACVMVLRLAPSATAPVIATLPPGTPVKTRHVRGAWHRVEARGAIGWWLAAPAP